MQTLSRTLLLLIAMLACVPAAAQLPVLAPMADTTIDVDSSFGVLQYASIAIPAGVTVRFTGNYPVRIRVAGNATIDGVLTVSPLAGSSGWGSWGPLGPGAVTTGAGVSGSVYWDPFTRSYIGSFPRSGQHAALYGSVIPFDLAGGSPGGSMSFFGGPTPGGHPGGGAGGTLVLDVGGQLDVQGGISAAGTGSQYSSGSGGSILLRALHGVTVAATGWVSARGGSLGSFGLGLVRIDTYDLPPILNGVAPAPTVVRLPDLTEVLPPVVGSTWQLRVMAPRGDTVFLSASFQPGSGTTPYGQVGIDLNTAIMFGTVTIPSTGHDLIGTFTLPVPNVPQLVGLQMWVQGLNWFTAQPPRYTQTIQAVVQ